MVWQQTSWGQQTCSNDERYFRTGVSFKNLHKSQHQSDCNHSVVQITLWSNAQVPSRHIMAISGHRSEASLRNYNTRPSSEQLRVCSDILSDAMKEGSQQSSTATSNLASSSLQSTSQQFVKYQPQALSSLFSNCNVTNVQVFMSHNSAGLH